MEEGKEGWKEIREEGSEDGREWKERKEGMEGTKEGRERKEGKGQWTEDNTERYTGI